MPLPTGSGAGAERAAQAKDDLEKDVSFDGIIQKFLLAFGGIALFVGIFVIANTLSITIAQRARVRHPADARRDPPADPALGPPRGVRDRPHRLDRRPVRPRARPRKVLNSLFVSRRHRPPAGHGLRDGERWSSLWSSECSITLAASLRPALRATRVPPIAAVREGRWFPLARRRFRRGSTIVVVAASVAVTRRLAHQERPRGISPRLLFLGGGMLLLSPSASPLNASRLVPAHAPPCLGWPAPGSAGGGGKRLARENATCRSNPSRTALTGPRHS